MTRIYEMVIHPANDKCPNINRMNEEPDCDNCEYCKYIGTFTGKFYAFNLRNNVQLRFYLRYPTSKKDEFESFIPQMLESIEAY